MRLHTRESWTNSPQPLAQETHPFIYNTSRRKPACLAACGKSRWLEARLLSPATGAGGGRGGDKQQLCNNQPHMPKTFLVTHYCPDFGPCFPLRDHSIRESRYMPLTFHTDARWQGGQFPLPRPRPLTSGLTPEPGFVQWKRPWVPPTLESLSNAADSPIIQVQKKEPLLVSFGDTSLIPA